jgi:hypothetical protein
MTHFRAKLYCHYLKQCKTAALTVLSVCEAVRVMLEAVEPVSKLCGVWTSCSA